jgi:hypothetical protein
MYMSQGATIRLRPGVAARLKDAFGCNTDTEVAETIGIDQSQYSRVVRGRSDPGPSFQARLLLRAESHGLRFDDLFEVVVDEPERESA